MTKVLRNVSEAELKLMFTRLVIKVQEEPEMFKDSKSGIDAFFDGEDKRRELLVDKPTKSIKSKECSCGKPKLENECFCPPCMDYYMELKD